MAEKDWRLFLVEHDLRGLTSRQLGSVHRALCEAVRRENKRGRRIRYVQRIYAPDEQRCLCLFEAPSPDLVRSVNDNAQFPLARVLVVLSSVPDAAGADSGAGAGAEADPNAGAGAEADPGVGAEAGVEADAAAGDP